jgi:hypothetical protein
VLRNHYHDSAEDAYLMQYRMEVEELANESDPVNRIASL